MTLKKEQVLRIHFGDLSLKGVEVTLRWWTQQYDFLPLTLSTAVALFVLRETAYDMRMITPVCLDFVQQNYDDGAFLSGDGDATRDLEYTFYGLLALGTLIENGKNTD